MMPLHWTSPIKTQSSYNVKFILKSELKTIEPRQGQKYNAE